MSPTQDASLRAYNSFQLESRAQWLQHVDSELSLRSALNWAKTQDLPITVLGQGSNSILQAVIPGLTLINRIAGRDILSDAEESVVVKIGAGEDWHETVLWCHEQGFYGLENLALIPGSVGAAPVQNIGAYGVELSELLICVHAIDRRTGESVVLSNSECEFSYRDSLFKRASGQDIIITSIELQLSRVAEPIVTYPALKAHLDAQFAIRLDAVENDPEDKRSLPQASHRDVLDAVVEIRRSKLPDPAEIPNVGSFFKNPILPTGKIEALKLEHPDMPVFEVDETHSKVSAGWLIDSLGWRGKTQNGVGVHEQHALVLVNRGALSAVAVITLTDEIQQSVRDRFAIDLVMEPAILGVETD
ncbi:MAG: UDP-N-acetylmuramate dehydrogenase [Luminiphilus sp.]|nr:UDP-N-acetylmuramate dehydrogenase [Luminiphilus sp.]